VQLKVGKTYRVKSVDAFKIRRPSAHRDWSDNPSYLKPGDLVHIESLRRTPNGFSYLVTARNESGVLHYDCGVNLSELMELVD
jgi:hypothetical protein